MLRLAAERVGVRLAAAVAGLLLIEACSVTRPATVQPATPVVLPTEVRVRVNGKIVTMPLETYAVGSALAEVNPSGERPETVARVFEMQVVLARTYAVAHMGRHRAEGFDLCDGTHCEVYDPARLTTSRFAADAQRAALATRGQILWYGNHPAEALFHADCGGHTAAPESIWGSSPVAYLRALPDDVPSLSHHTWQFTMSREDLRRALNLDPLTAVGTRLDDLVVAERDPSGRAMTVALNGQRPLIVRGEELRAIVNRTVGPRGIQSTLFKVTRRGTAFVFDGSGNGHGVGLCQLGALARARQGATSETVLQYYFPGAKLGK